MRRKAFWQTLASAALFIAVFLISDVFSFGVIFELLYDKLPEFSIQIIASGVSLILTIAILTLTRFSILRRYRNAFVQTSDIIEKLTAGDFDVAPAGDFRLDPKLGGFVKSIDTMALQLKKIETMRREFVSNVSHEIQSPLTSIRGYAAALTDEHLSPEKRRDYLTVIRSESDRLSNLSENLLRLAALDAEAGVIKMNAYRLDRQIRSVISACEPLWSEKHIDVTADLTEITIQTDRELAEHMWTNLIGNAVKFTPDGGRVHISLLAQSGNAICRIADTGIGITPEALPRIFDRFYKADESRSLFNGNGLGLAIVRKIAELLDGDVAAESEFGKGTAFTVTLPLLLVSHAG
ncbi:MAG: HAMP domain-containing histidine kinase [Clostridiales Family XIII bacterium]|jgi:signal transduction histidine kinase|nr:HAMP domain-containing histidine kinase [Clostridiales Family XIII bacterium]